MPEITFVISKDRKTVKLEINGVKGEVCTDLAKPFAEALGIKDDDLIIKSEYYEQEDNEQLYEKY